MSHLLDKVSAAPGREDLPSTLTYPQEPRPGTRRRLRILVAGLRSPDSEGGIESHARHLYPYVAAMNCEVEIAVRQPTGALPPPTRWGDITLRAFWAPRSMGLEAIVHTLLATLYAIRSRPDVYHIHAIGPALFAPLARLFGIRVVVTHHGPDFDREKWGRFGRFVLRLGERLGMRFASARVVISGTIRDQVAARYGIACTVIPNGVTRPEPTQSTRVLDELGLSPGRYVLQVSRFVPEKRQADLVHAFLAARLGDDWRLVFAGDASPRNRYATKVRAYAAHDERIVFAGFRSGEALTEIYQNAGVFVLPSSHEGLPIALLEALSYGLPVIVSDIAANLETGLPPHCYFRLGKADELAARLEAAAASPSEPGDAAARQRWVLDRYDWDRIAAETVVVYQRVAGENPATGADELRANGLGR